MIASIVKLDNVYIAQYERHMKHSLEQVWAMLTDNDRLPLWFPELRVEDLRVGGIIKFDIQDGTFLDMTITDFNSQSVLEYTWGVDQVRFELYPEAEGTHLILKETIHKMTDHTPKDLAGWHVCLDVIEALLDGKVIENRKEEWKKWYEKYVAAVENM